MVEQSLVATEMQAIFIVYFMDLVMRGIYGTQSNDMAHENQCLDSYYNRSFAAVKS